MKKHFLILIALMLMLLCSACTDGGMNSPSGDLFTPNVSSSPTSDPSAESPLISGITEAGKDIKDFVEGTIVDVESIPLIVKAVKDKYNDAEVTGATHAMHMNKQVYEVKFKDGTGKTRTVYVSPDGKNVSEAADITATQNPSASPDISPDISATPTTSATPSDSPTPTSTQKTEEG